jgi:ribosome-binding ATPase YchF (GTP1/OBG family)
MSEDKLMQLERLYIQHDKDIGVIANSVEKIEKHMAETNSILREFNTAEVRNQARFEKIETLIENKIQHVQESSERAHSRIDEQKSIITRINWIIVTSVVLGVMSLLITK